MRQTVACKTSSKETSKVEYDAVSDIKKKSWVKNSTILKLENKNNPAKKKICEQKCMIALIFFFLLIIHRKCIRCFVIWWFYSHLGPDYMSRAGPGKRAGVRLPGITWGEPARLMADVMKRVRPMADAMKRRRPDAMKRGRPCLILVRRRHEPLAGSCSFHNGHYKNTANDRNDCLFPAAVGCINYLLHSCAWTLIFVSSI